MIHYFFLLHLELATSFTMKGNIVRKPAQTYKGIQQWMSSSQSAMGPHGNYGPRPPILSGAMMFFIRNVALVKVNSLLASRTLL